MNASASQSATRQRYFHDERRPQEIQHVVERELMILLAARKDAESLEFRGTAWMNGVTCKVVLRFLAALPRTNAYWLELTLSWAHLPTMHHDFHRKTADAWFDLWMRHFTAAAPPLPGDGSPTRYHELVEPVLRAEAEPDSVEIVQQKILAALREGRTFSTSHKEGGTTIYWKNGRCRREDHGESSAWEIFADDAAFFLFLRTYYDWETGHSFPPGEKPSELVRWQLIQRLIH